MMKMELGLCCQMDSQLNPNSTPYWQTQCTTSQSLDSLSIHLSRWYKIDWNHCVTHQCLECSRGLMNGQVTNQHADLLYFVGKTIHTAILDQEWGALGSGPSTNQHWDPEHCLAHFWLLSLFSQNKVAVVAAMPTFQFKACIISYGVVVWTSVRVALGPL